MKRYLGILVIWLLLGCGGSDHEPSGSTGPSDPPPTCNFLFDFESGIEGWQASGWSRASDDAYVGAFSMTSASYTRPERHCGEQLYFYPDRELILTSGIDLSECSSATMTFWHKLRVQSIRGVSTPFCQWEDGRMQWCTVEISLNGDPWITIDSFGFDRVVNGWTKVRIPLDSYVGPGSSNVRLAFRMAAGYSQWTNCLWRIDRIEIEDS
ncbi:MAG: hypothetical protein KJ970_03665 [Candidatus Eisenbacteria bacterium]|uniref:Uncharacterized protein n=1 Tax=Eiseniibacteriota bacterium TaxID=2212470 RepID=A0A948RUM1_UNCEI|nr:hypothetical protein [Candidatus Eisenbacteria bacterium]MBU1949924.1 hypothetical protein [Candidatus Eisenbacteria bacterium]MBU2689999.1 hypothetical protein [Candidatus Eisenbacteria bacterium]